MTMMIKVGNAPVSYGAFEVTVGLSADVPSAEQVLDAAQAAGYQGIDLGPLGYLGLGANLKEALESRSLLLTGGYVEVDISSADKATVGLAELEQVCDQFDAVADGVAPEFLPRPTVALTGPAAGDTRSRWRQIERAIGGLMERCARRGYEACLHNEVGTQIAGQDSVLRLLESTPVALCLDTGHLIAAGGDPIAILEGWPDRVRHVHLKDVRLPASRQPFETAMQAWETGAFCPLGTGDGRIDEVLASLRANGYSGWIVVEQDVLPRDEAAYRQARDNQVVNREYLRSRGW
jgi:inosose dehydratase